MDHPNFYLDLILAIGKKLTPNCGLLYTVRHPLSRDVLLIIFDMFHRQFGWYRSGDRKLLNENKTKHRDWVDDANCITFLLRVGCVSKFDTQREGLRQKYNGIHNNVGSTWREAHSWSCPWGLWRPTGPARQSSLDLLAPIWEFLGGMWDRDWPNDVGQNHHRRMILLRRKKGGKARLISTRISKSQTHKRWIYMKGETYIY